MIKKTKGDYTVVIDGANFIRDNAEFSFVPEKLHQVLRFIEKRGGRPVALLSKTTYPKMKKELKGDRFRQLLIQFDRRIAEGSIQLVAENDDLRCIQRALEWDVILLSQDQWAAERKRFASYDWTRLDELQISKYDSTRNTFSSEKLLDYLEESFHLRLHQLIAESCGREGGCDKTSIMEKMAVEFLPGDTFVREQHGWVKDLRAIVNLLGDGNKMTLANWITKNLPESFQEREGQIMPVSR